jgi:hypothetical protein
MVFGRQFSVVGESVSDFEVRISDFASIEPGLVSFQAFR